MKRIDFIKLSILAILLSMYISCGVIQYEKYATSKLVDIQQKNSYFYLFRNTDYYLMFENDMAIKVGSRHGYNIGEVYDIYRGEYMNSLVYKVLKKK